MSQQNSAVAKLAATALGSYNGDLTERQKAVGLGSSNVTANDMAIPRIKLLQAISPEVQVGHAEHVQGATAGMIMNSLDSSLHSSLFLVNLHFSRRTVVWKKRKLGGGMFGAFDTEAEALIALHDAGEDEKNYDISENPTHLVMLLDAEGTPKATALLDMPGVKAKVSKRWNSMIAAAEAEGNPRFGCVWHLGVVPESNTQGNYMNFDLLDIADGAKYIVAPDEIYQEALKRFNAYFANEAKQDEAA